MATPHNSPTRRNKDLRRANSIAVLDLLRRLGRLTRADLTEHTTLSHQALATILNELVQSGYAIEVETHGGRRGRGRPALQYEYNPHRNTVVSLYIGLRYAEVSVCDGLGRPIGESTELAPGWEVDEVVTQAARGIDQMLDRERIDRTRCHVGVVFHGWVDTRAGTATNTAMGWDAVPIVKLLASELDMEVSVHEASRAAAIAEYREGSAQGAHRATVLNIGPEITATQVIDGAVDTGSGGFAGMIGQCRVVDPEGSHTPIDDLIGSFATKRRYIEKTGEHVDWMADVYDLARKGDPAAREVLQLPLEVIGFAASWLITITNPTCFVMTGAMGDYDEEMKAGVHRRILELTDPRMLEECSIHFSSLSRQAWIRGGVHAALDHQRSMDPLTIG